MAYATYCISYGTRIRTSDSVHSLWSQLRNNLKLATKPRQQPRPILIESKGKVALLVEVMKCANGIAKKPWRAE